MSNLPALPEHVDPNTRFVELRVMECRECGDVGPAADTRNPDDPSHLWDSNHHDGTGHTRFYAWTMSRSTAQTFRTASLRRKRK